MTAPPAPFIPEPLQGTQAIAVAVCYTGDIAEGERLLKPLRTFGSPDENLIQPMPYTALQGFLDASAPAGLQNYWKAHYLGELTDDAIDTFVAHSTEIPSPLTHADIHHLGGAFAKLKRNDETAFAHRGAAYILNIVSTWPDPAENDRQVSWTREFFEAMRPFSTGGAYVNFMDRGEEGRIKSAYGENYDRLFALKKKYDPKNMFRFNQNIDPSR